MTKLMNDLKTTIKDLVTEQETPFHAAHDTMFMRVKLSIEKTPYNIDFLFAEREDGIKHKIGYTNKMFYSIKLALMKYRIINEIQMMTNKKVIVVTAFKNRNIGTNIINN